jgi:predicted DNA-binding protein (MmcQ/YjbR family)
MNKKHWNTVYVEELDRNLLYQLIGHSYDLVYGSLTKAKRLELEKRF